VSVARGVMEHTPHVMLCGKGAREFAIRQGCALVEQPADYYRLPVGVEAEETRVPSHGTVGAVALDSDGRLAAATSTGGTFGKLEGRVGDTPLIGAGTWADENVAISCKGTGEYFIRTGAALSIACRVRSGASLAPAIDELLADVKALGGDGGVIAVSRTGEIVMRYNSAGMKRASAGSDEALVSRTFRT
jgi:isoaspartyl peptidase/L-asparaginase-like protein (Ntn-hydrolase superfamily)